MQFSPSVYEHAARLIDKTPWETSRDAGLLCEAHAEAFRLYNHSPVVVGIDIYNLEAEAYGATVQRPEGTGIPAVTQPMLGDLAELLDLPPLDLGSGRLGMVIDVGRRLKRMHPWADIRIPVSGPFSIAASLVGFETLLTQCAVVPNLGRVGLSRLAKNQVAFARAIAEAGLDVALFESAAAPPLLSPEQFREIEVPAVEPLVFEVANVVGHSVSFVMGGDTASILKAILGMGSGYVVCPIETDQELFMRTIASHPDVMVRVNMDHRVVAGLSWDAIQREADRAMELACRRERACIGTGALPYETLPEHVVRLKEYVLEGPRRERG